MALKMRAVVAAAALTAARAYGDGAARHRLEEAERWLYAGAPPPSNWEITSKRDLPPSSKWSDLNSGNSKRVRATTYASRPVVVKEALAKGHWNERNVRGELLWLEYLRGAPGIPRLYGGFFTDNGTKVSLVAQRAGRPLARGKGTRASRTMLLKEWKNWCQSKPLEALRALLLCFRSFAEVGGSFLKDFSPHQFTVGKNEVFLIDGPDALSGPLYDVFAARNLPTVYDGPVQKCSSEDKCPATSPAHCCCGGTSAKTRCEKGAKGAPEAAGGCAAGSCQRVSAKTHVFDVAAKVWAFPYVLNFVELAPARKLALRRLQVWMERPLVGDRPNFTEALAALDGVS